MLVDIYTERLILRSIRQNDAMRINQLVNNKEITSMIEQIPYPCSLDDTKDWINMQAEACNKGEHANFAIILQEFDMLIGVIGLEIDKKHERGQLGYWIGQDYWGKGFASEAAISIIKYAFEKLKLHRVYASCVKENMASSKVLEKAGLQYEGCFREHLKKDGIFKDMKCYGVLARFNTF